VVVVRDSVCSRFSKVLTVKCETKDEFSNQVIFLTCMPYFHLLGDLSKGHTGGDSASLRVVWYVCSSHSTLPSSRPRGWAVLLLLGANIASSILACFPAFVSLVDVCPASTKHPLSLPRYELLSLSSTQAEGEKCSWRRIVSCCEPWSPSYYTHVRRTAKVGISRPDRS